MKLEIGLSSQGAGGGEGRGAWGSGRRKEAVNPGCGITGGPPAICPLQL